MDDFQILSKLGEGAYSIVYKVMRKVDKKIYALKKVKLLNLSDKEKENALNEVRILASVKSNFVVSYKEAFFDEKDRTLCIVMEFADNGDLLQKITEHKKRSIFFDESTIWHIFIQLVRGLKSLHDLNILHRDLKCANVFLYSNGEAKIGDLNVSKVTRGGMGTTQTGTPYYASPEVWNDCPYDSKSDIWSLGCVLYEMITLKPPFRAADMEGLYKKVTKGQYSKIPDIFSNDLHQIIIFLLQVNPKLRPSCDQILNHPIVQKRIDYFKVITGENENKVNKNNNKGLLKTIHMPKNLIFLSDKLPKPNYDKSIKEEIEENDERNGISYQEIEHKEINEGNNIKKYNSLSNPVKYYEHANSLGNIQPGYNFKKLGIILNSNKIGLMPPFMVKNININQKQQHNVNLPNIANGDKISLNRRKKNMQKQLVSLDIISKQKNELSKLMLNNNIHRKLHYLNNRGYLNPIQMKDLYKIYPNLNNRSLPQKLDQNKLKQKYLNHQDSKKDYINEIKKIENDHEYNIKNNNKYVIKNIYNNDIIIKKEKEKIKEEKEGPEIKIFPKKKLNPIKVTKKSEE